MKRLVIGLAVLSCCLGAAVRGQDAKPAAGPIKIGAILGVTGPAANLGGPEEKTVRMLVERFNAEGGILGRKVELIVKDSGGSPEKAVSFAKQLIEEDKVLAIVGPSTSGETLQIKPICESEKTILVSCAAAETIVKPVAKYVFKTPQTDSQAATLIFATMKKKNISKIAVLSDNTGFGKAGKEQLEKLAPQDGIQILASEVYDKDATDLTAILAKVKAAGVQALVNWSVVPAQSIVAKNMRQMGFDVPLFQSHGFGNLKYVAAAGQAAEGIVFPASRLLVVDVLPADHVQKRVLATYKKDYEDRFKEEVSTFGGHAYDAVMVLKAAIEKAGSVDSEKVRDALENLKGFVGTAGVFNFSPEDHCGLSLDAFEMLEVKDGKFNLHSGK